MDLILDASNNEWLSMSVYTYRLNLYTSFTLGFLVAAFSSFAIYIYKKDIHK